MPEADVYPDGEYRPLGKQTEDRMTGHDILCLHTMVGYLTSSDNYFRTGNGAGYAGTESHYGVGGKWGPDLAKNLDGKVWQWQDRAYTADANLFGAPRVISIETADNAGSPIAPWTPKQVEGIAQLLAWESTTKAHAKCPSTWTCHKVGIPLVLIPDTKPGRRGVGYHRQGIEPWLVDGGVKWSMSRGKGCPDPARIAQITSEVLPRAVQIAEDDMEFTDAVPGLTDPDGSPVQVGEALPRGNYAYRSVLPGGALEKRVAVLEARVDATTDAHADYAYDAVTEGGSIDKRLDALQAALAELGSTPDGSVESRLTAVEGVLAKLKDALS